MHVFIDDSGCGGFKFDKGSTSHLVMAACVFRDPKEIEHLAAQAGKCRMSASHQREFRYSKCSDGVRDKFFDHITDVDFSIRTIIMDKANIYSPALRASPSMLKSYAIRMLLTKNYGEIRNAKVVIDGQDGKAFGMSDADYFMRMVNRESPGTISTVKFDDSSANIGIQLADMCAGAIRRGMQAKKRNDRHLVPIRPRTYQPAGSFWVFG